MRERKKKRLIIFSMIGLLFIMAAGYAAFRTNLDIKGTSSINSNWDIRITNVTESNTNGDGESAKAPTWEATKAYMEANLYNKGDYVEYDVTIENKGTFDASLSDVITNVKSNNEAVKITFSNYTKGEMLYKNTSKIIKVKIEYNPDYEGEGEGSGEVEVDFTYDQAEGGTIVPTDKYLVTYDCETNGGSDCTSYNEYLSEGSSINLTYQGTDKKYYNFVGWNTDSTATEGLTNLNMGSNDITLYAIYQEKDPTDPIIDSVNTTASTGSITVVVNAHDDESEIIKYEYSKDGGKTWEVGEGNTYTFTGLTQNTEYDIKVRVTNAVDKTAESETQKVTTKVLEEPTFSESETSKGKDITITYPEGCGDSLTCTYIKDDGEEVEVTEKTITVSFTSEGSLIAKVSDGTNEASSSYNVTFPAIIQSWGYSASTDFHNSTYRENIITATFLDNKEVPDNAVASWDVSDAKNGTVVAWVIADESDSTKYHLYIGGNGGVIANKSSSYLFRNFTSLTEITFGDNFDTSNVTNMSSMFSGCSKLTTIDVSNWDTSNVTSMYSMFRYCSNLTTIDVNNWDTSKVTSMGAMFIYCSNLTTIDVSNWDTSNVANMDAMFYNCSNLATLDVSNFDTSKVTSMGAMFSGCSNLTTIDVSKWDTSNVTNMGAMFHSCSSLITINVGNFDTSNVTSMGAMFFGCEKLERLDLSNFKTNKLTSVYNYSHSAGGGSAGLFENCSNLKEITFGINFDTSNVTSMNFMFKGCSSLTTIDVGNFDISNVISMNSMFYGCSSLTTLDLSNFDTSNVTSMSNMLEGCSNLTTLDVSNFDTSNVTNMSDMFYGCSSLTKLILCSFDTNKVTSMNYMFYGTSNLKSIYAGPNWTTANATTTNMFNNSGVSSVTQSDNCEVDAEDMSLNIATSKTTNSITVVATAQADSGISKYEYRINSGSWVNGGTSKTHTFTGLKNNTTYTVETRVTSGVSKTATKSASVKTNNITLPTFSESGTTTKTVKITYPSGCGSTYTCTYIKDGGSPVPVTSTTISVNFDAYGDIVAKVSDGTNTVSSSHTVIVIYPPVVDV